MKNNWAYNGEKSEVFKKYYEIKNEDFEKIKDKIYKNICKNIVARNKNINVLLIGVGYGRLEIPLIEQLIKSCKNLKINIVAVDPSNEWLDEFCENIRKVLNSQSIEHKINKCNDSCSVIEENNCHQVVINPVEKRIEELADEVFKIKYNIITAFFVFQFIDQWANILKKIMDGLTEGGVLLYGEEAGFTALIDGKFLNPKDMEKYKDWKDWAELIKEFHNQRYILGKPWFQFFTASDHSILSEMLDTAGWNRLIDETIEFENFQIPDYSELEQWIDMDPVLFTPLGKYLTQKEKNSIKEKIKEKIEKIKSAKTANNRTEAIRFLAFQKPEKTEEKTEEINNYNYEKILEKAINRFFYKKFYSFSIIRESMEDFFKSLKPPEFRSKNYENTVVKSRLFIIGNSIFNLLSDKVHLDYVLWQPDFYDLSKGYYLDNLPTLIMFKDIDEKKRYIISYGLYFFARKALKITQTFLNAFFKEIPIFSKVMIERDMYSNEIKIEIKLDKDSSLYFLHIIMPYIEIDDNIVNLVVNNFNMKKFEEENEVFYNFDNFLDLIENKLKNNDEILNCLKDEINNTYKNFESNYLSSAQSKISEIKAKINVDVDHEASSLAVEFLKNLFAFNFIASCCKNTRWKKITFNYGFIFSETAKMEGFTVIVDISFSSNFSPSDFIIKQLLPLYTSQDGLYSSIRLIKLETTKHALRSAVAAIMARNMSHNIGSHILARSEVKDIKKRLKDDLKVNSTPQKNILDLVNILKSRLDRYIKQKSDFLAEISSEPLATTKSLMFYKEVLLPFIMNAQLMDTIAANEGIRYKNNEENRLKIRCFVNEDELTPEFSCLEEDGHNSSIPIYNEYPYSGICNLGHDLVIKSIKNGDKDVEVELPGPLGEFAIYGFLENFIRNTAKHEKEKVGDKDLEIFIQILEDKEFPEFYKIRIWNNVTNPEEKMEGEIDGKKYQNLREMVNAYIKSRIIKDTGELKRQAWGIAEMKINSLLLYGSIDFEKMKEKLEVKSIERSKLPGGDSSSEKALVYEFKLMKSKFAYILTKQIGSGENEELVRYGIKIFNSFNDLKNELTQAESFASPKFVIIDQNALNGEDIKELENLKPFMPFRVMWVNNDSKALLEIKIDKIEEWKQTVWDLWIKMINKDKDKKICLHIFLEQNLDENPTAKWAEFAEDFNNKNYCVKIKIWEKDNKFTSSEGDCQIHVGYDRHGGIKHILERLSGNISLRAEDIDPKITIDKLSSDFTHIFTENIKPTLPFELVEPLLIKVGVADDRIAEKSDEKIKIGFDERSLFEWALGSEIYLISHLKFKNELKAVHSKVENGFENEGKFILDLDEYKLYNSEEEINVQMLILHQGLIDDLHLSANEQENLLLNIQKKIPFLVIDSGRGIPPTLSPKVKFLPYSLLEQYLTRRISKYCLVHTCMSLTRRKEK